MKIKMIAIAAAAAVASCFATSAFAQTAITETAVAEPGHTYTVITAVSGLTENFVFRDILASPAFCSKKNGDAEAYIMKYIRKETRVLDGLRHASSLNESEIAAIERKLTEYGKILELVKK